VAQETRHGRHAPDTVTANFAIGREEWKAARRKASADGHTISAVIRDLIRRWMAGEITTPPPADRTT
jgi:hypothetical protein